MVDNILEIPKITNLRSRHLIIFKVIRIAIFSNKVNSILRST